MGKTITGLALCRKRGKRTLWLAHREELVSQPAKALTLVWPDATYGVVKAERNEFMRQVVFASIQSAQQERRIQQLVAQGFGTIVVDEAHRSLSDGYVELFKRLGCFDEGGPMLLGLTATPERSDNGALSDVFQGVVYQVGIAAAIDGGYLVPPNIVERPIRLDLDTLKTSRGDYAVAELDLALMQAGIVQEITSAYEEHCSNGRRKSLIFTVSIDQAHRVADELSTRGHAVAALSGNTGGEERKRILRKLHTGELQAVVNCNVLTEGFDEPSVDAVILARPTQSKPMMIQMVGRGLRLHPGKADCLVLDMAGVSKRNTLVQAAVLFGAKPEPEEAPTNVVSQLDPMIDADEFWKARLKTQIQGVRGAPRSRMRWLSGANGAWLLNAGTFGTLRMVPAANPDEFTVDAVGITEEGQPNRLDLSLVPVSLDVAQALAEDYVRRVNMVTLARNGGSWRDQLASDAQKKMLERKGIRTEGMTKGQAADYITQIKATEATEPPTPKQISYLRHLGVDTSAVKTKTEAKRAIARARTA